MTNSSNEKEYIILLGNFGSGKSELALHFAMSAAKAGKHTSLVDLDMVNPYFRASDRHQWLAENGIRLITPNYALSPVEAIMINPEIYSVFANGEGMVIFDVGGDNIGATALGQYWEYFDRIPKDRLKIWLVINPLRPLSATPELVIDMMTKIETSARVKINGLINNGNLSTESSRDDLLFSYKIIKEVSEKTNIPVILTSGEEEVLDEFISKQDKKELDKKYIGEPVVINTIMHRDWQRLVKLGI